MIVVNGDGNFVENGVEATEVTTITLEDIQNRIAHFGFELTSSDEDFIVYEACETISYVLNYCNIMTIPSILNHRIIDKICYKVLFNKKNSGTLNGFDYEVAVREIKEGDTTVKYAVGQGEDTAENRFDALVKELERGFDKWLTPHRCLRW